MARIDCNQSPLFILEVPEPVNLAQVMAVISFANLKVESGCVVEIHAGKSFIKIAKEIMKGVSHGTH